MQMYTKLAHFLVYKSILLKYTLNGTVVKQLDTQLVCTQLVCLYNLSATILQVNLYTDSLLVTVNTYSTF